MSFGAKYKKITETIKDDLTRLEEELKSEINLYPALNEALAGFLTSKSKRIRAVAAFLYLRASGFEPDERQYNLQFKQPSKLYTMPHYCMMMLLMNVTPEEAKQP